VSNTNITNLEISDTFQVWINKTNEIIDLTNENVILAGPGAGFTVEGNSTLVGSFTANTLNSDTLTSDSISITTVERKNDLSLPINFISPISITSNVENIFTVTTTAGNRPILRLVNGANARWAIGQSTSSASSPITIRLEGSTNPQLTLTQAGRLSVSELEGNGSLITDINASNVIGTLDTDRIPNLDTSKITTGIFADARIPNLNANKITDGTISSSVLPASATRGEISSSDISDTNSLTQGFITGRRFRSALTWNNVNGKPSTFPPSSHTHGGEEITTGTISSSVLPASATRGEISLENLINSSSSIQGFISGRRLTSAIEQLSSVKGFITFNGSNGQVFNSKNMSISKLGSGNYNINISSSLQTGNSNWNILITANGTSGVTSQGYRVREGALNVYNTWVSARTSSRFNIRSTRSLNNVFAGGELGGLPIGELGNTDDAIRYQQFRVITDDPTYITVAIV
jgi:hypothetical protein